MKKKSAFSLSDGNAIDYGITTRRVNDSDYLPNNEKMLVGNFDYTSCCMMDMQVATTGGMGGDAGHGSRTSIDLTLGDCFCGKMSISYERGQDYPHLHLTMAGDCELDQITDALMNAAMFLHKASRRADIEIKEIEEWKNEPMISV